MSATVDIHARLSAAFTLSFEKASTFGPTPWVGLENYRTLLTDPGTRTVFLHTLIYCAGYLPLVFAGGLGLALVKSLVEASGGEIRYEPRPEGGASFDISLAAPA